MESEIIFVKRLIQGDKKTFKKFFENFYPSVCIFAQRYVKDLALAQDIAQESFIIFWEQKERFDNIKAIKGFIYTVTRNKCLNKIKTENIHQNILNKKISGDEYFYELILEEETYNSLHQAVEKLAPQMQRIIFLSLAGKKNQEIADLLDISINTVKTHKKNAYKELRVQLAGHEFIILLLCFHLIYSG